MVTNRDRGPERFWLPRMTSRGLQKRYLVTELQPLLSYNVTMKRSAKQRRDKSSAPTRKAPNSSRTCARLCRAGLVAVVLVGIGVLATACGGGPSSPGIASVGKATTTIGSTAAQGGSGASLENALLGYTNCMRTHGEPNMPEPTANGSGVHISAAVGAGGFDPNTPQFAAASKACEHLLPKRGSGPNGGTITTADQADYLKAAACMRSHGVPDFPDPTFENNSIEFIGATPIDTSSARYKSALTTCQKLVPAGLPYSGTGGS